jgi:hypothetical protein
MRGIVRYMNLTNAMAAVETEEGFTVFEVLERCAIDIGDEIAGPLASSGDSTLHNVTKKEDFEVAIGTSRCNRVEAVEMLG